METRIIRSIEKRKIMVMVPLYIWARVYVAVSVIYKVIALVNYYFSSKTVVYAGKDEVEM